MIYRYYYDANGNIVYTELRNSMIAVNTDLPWIDSNQRWDDRHYRVDLSAQIPVIVAKE